MLCGAGGGVLTAKAATPSSPLVGTELWLGTCCDVGGGVTDSSFSAIRDGWRGIDTAAHYENEADIAAGIAAAVAQGILCDPSEVSVVSKVWFDDMTTAKAMASIRRSHDFLGGALDTMLVHFPGSIDAVQSPAANRRARLETWGALERAKADGLVRTIGVSNYVPRHARELLRTGAVPDVVQLESHPFCANADLVALWKNAGVPAVQAYSPFASGRAPVLTDPSLAALAASLPQPSAPHPAAASPRGAPNAAAAAAVVTPAQVVLAWLRGRGLAPVVKCSTARHRAEAAGALSLRLSDEAAATFEALDRGPAGSVAFDARLVA